MEDIRKLLDNEKFIIGTERNLKALRKGDLQKIFVCSNASSQVKEDIEHYASLSETPVEHLKITNVDLGTLCRKQFSVAVVGLGK